MPPALNLTKARLRVHRRNVVKTLRDIGNKLRFGPQAPLSDEPLFVDPAKVKWQYGPTGPDSPPPYHQIHSGLVVDGDWDLSVIDVTKTPKFVACQARFVEGKSWEETGVIDLMMMRIDKWGVFDGCRSKADVIRRYDRIDRLYDAMSKRDRLSLKQDLPGKNRREAGGILGHINRHGEVIRYVDGNHRFTIARILNYREIPVQVGVVHRHAITSGALKPLRQSIYA